MSAREPLRKLNDLGSVGAVLACDLSHAGERLEKNIGWVGSGYSALRTGDEEVPVAELPQRRFFDEPAEGGSSKLSQTLTNVVFAKISSVIPFPAKGRWSAPDCRPTFMAGP
jgi:hypothetical protein